MKLEKQVVKPEWFNIPPLAHGCRVHTRRQLTGREERPQRYWAFPPFSSAFLPVQAVTSFAQHPDNANVALRMRVARDTPDVSKKGHMSWKTAREEFGILKDLYRLKSLPRWTPKELLAVKRGADRRRYTQVAATLRRESLGKRDFQVEAFVKSQVEAHLATHEVVGKPLRPRLVIHRSYREIFELGRYLHPVERQVYSTTSEGRFGLAGDTLLHMKGLPLKEVARQIVQKTHDVARGSAVGKWAAFELDESSFEAHVNKPQRWVFDRVLRKCFPNDRYLRWMLQQHQKAKGRTKWFKFEVAGKLCSGDSETALLANVTVVGKFLRFAKSMGLEGFQLGDNGDNLLVICRYEDLDRIKSHLAKFYLDHYGAEVTSEAETSVLEGIRFCRSGIMELGREEYRMVRPPRRILAGLYVTLQGECKQKALARIMAKALTEYVLHKGVPVVQDIALQTFHKAWEAFPPGRRGRLPRLLRPSKEDFWKYGAEFGGQTDLLKIAEVDWRTGQASHVSPPSRIARVSWGALWGIAPDSQRRIEREAHDWGGGFDRPTSVWGPPFIKWEPRWPYW